MGLIRKVLHPSAVETMAGKKLGKMYSKQKKTMGSGGGSRGQDSSTETAPKTPRLKAFPKRELTEEEKILKGDKITEAINWNNERSYADDTIETIRTNIGSWVTDTKFTEEDVQLIASWQKSSGFASKEIDGKFGTQSCNKISLSPDYSNCLLLGSGSQNWCDQKGYIGSKDLNDLEGSFKTDAKNVVNGIRAAGGEVTITSTFRHPARVAVMYYAKYVHGTGKDASLALDKFKSYNFTVDAGTKDNSDRALKSFSVREGAPVALNSNHSDRHAVDLKITKLPKKFKVNDKDVETSGDKGGYASNASELNSVLKKLANAGKSPVDKFVWYGYGDDVHWSKSGN